MRFIARITTAVSLVLSVCAVFNCADYARAQGDGQDSTHSKLTKTVQLVLGATTVAKTMSALSEQTGLTIKAADYLNERKLIVRMENLSASAALDAIDELNDWTWRQTSPEQILVTRRELRLKATPAAVPRMMQACVPKDIRTYFSMPTPTEDMSKLKSMFDNGLGALFSIVDMRVSKTVAMDQFNLITSLTPAILTGDPIPYSKLTDRQRSELIVSFVFPLLKSTDYALMHGDLMPHVADVNNAVIKRSGDMGLLIGTSVSFGGIERAVWFGAPIR